MWAAAIKVIIDIGNPVASDLSGLVTPSGSSGGQETANRKRSTPRLSNRDRSPYQRVAA